MRGHLRQRGSDRWELVVGAGKDPVTGRYRQVSKTVRGTKREAERHLRALLTEVEEERHVGSDATVGDLLARWLDLVGDNLSPRTLSVWQTYIRRRILPALGTKPVRKLATADLDIFYRSLTRDHGLAPATVRQIHSILRRALRQAVRWRWIPANPATEATLPRQVKPDLHCPEPEEVRAVVARARQHDPSMATLLVVAADTGARRGELCGLRWSDIDWETGELTIERSVGVVGTTPYVKDTKTHQARQITLDVSTLALLEARKTAQEAEAAKAGAMLRPDGYVFSDATDGSEVWNPESVTWRFRTLRDALGYRFRLHDIRHFVGTQLIDSGQPLPGVSRRLGHRRTSTTADIYAHAVRTRDKEAAAVMGALLQEPPDEITDL